MNQTINLPSLISKISATTGAAPAEVRRFLHELFDAVESWLSTGESVSIDGIGEFVCGDDATRPVLFRPDAQLAAQINEPFAAFEAVELFDGAESDILAASEPKVNLDIEDAPIYIPEPKDEVIEIEQPADYETYNASEDAADELVEEAMANLEPAEAPEAVSVPEYVPEPVVEPESEPEFQNTTYSVPDIPEDEDDDEPSAAEAYNEEPVAPHEPQKTVLWLVIGVLIGLIIGLCGGYFAGKLMGTYTLPDDFEYPEVETVEEFEETQPDEVPADVTETVVQSSEQADAMPVQAKPEPVENAAPAQSTSAKAEPVYDTVTKSRYLSILAKEHYGVKNYWIFIYEANPELGNPNKIAPGTRVLIPDRSTFEEATPEATAAKAARRMGELGKKYKF